MSNLFALKGDNIIDLFEVKIDDYEGFFRFHGSKNFKNNLIFQGNEYVFLPCEMSNLAYDSEGKQNRPTLTLSNVNGFISNVLVENRDLVGKYLLRKKILSRDLDDVNFGAGENKNVFGPSGKFTGFISSDKFYIHKKNIENRERVEFELSNILDIEGVTIPSRKVYNNHCPFEYRGCGCNYGKEKNYAGPDLNLKLGYLAGGSVEGALENLTADTKNKLVVWLNNGGLGGVETDPNWNNEEITKYYSFKPTPDAIVPESNRKNGGNFSEFIKPQFSKFERATKLVSGIFNYKNVNYFTLRRGVFNNGVFTPSDDSLSNFNMDGPLWHKNYWPNAAASINTTLTANFETDYAVFEPFPWINYNQIQQNMAANNVDYINTVYGYQRAIEVAKAHMLGVVPPEPMERGCIFWNQTRRNNQYGISPLGSLHSQVTSCYSQSGVNWTRLKINNNFSEKDITIICVTEPINVFYPAVMGTNRTPWDINVIRDDSAVAGGWFANGMCTSDNTFRLGYSGWRKEPNWKWQAGSGSITGVCYHQGKAIKGYGEPTLYNTEGGINKAAVDAVVIPSQQNQDVIYYRNGTERGRAKSSGANDLGSSERKKIGFNQNPNTLSDIIVYEVLIFEKQLSQQEIAFISKSLITKFGIGFVASPLPDDLDYSGSTLTGGEEKSSLSFFTDPYYSSNFKYPINITEQQVGGELIFNIDKNLKFSPGHEVKIFSDQKNYMIVIVNSYDSSTGEFNCKIKEKGSHAENKEILLWKLQINNPRSVGVMNLGVPMADENNKTFFKEPGSSYFDSYDLKELKYKGDYNGKSIYSKGDFVKIESSINYDFEKSVMHKDSEFPTRFFVCVSENEISGIHPLDRKDVWVEDSCAKNISACSLRHRAGQKSESNINYLAEGFVKKIPFGGFPGTVDYDYRLPS